MLLRCLLLNLLLVWSVHSNAQVGIRLQLSAAALKLTNQQVVYNPAYVSIPYPMGDVPAHTGACTDVVIRAYRQLHIDLQQLVHEDMEAHFSLYPQLWGRKSTDKNIDHRRVLNLMTFFSRKGQKLSISQNPDNYLPGDIVCWEISPGVTHIGIVIAQRSKDGKRRLIVHNIGRGQVTEDCLFDYKIIGHYFYPIQ